MSSRRTLLTVLAAATGLAERRLEYLGQSLARAGMLTPGTQGGVAPPPSGRDATRLLAAVLAGDHPSRAPREAARILRFVRTAESRADDLRAPPWLREAARAETFETALCGLIDSALELQAWIGDVVALGQADPTPGDRILCIEVRVVVRRGIGASIVAVAPLSGGGGIVLCEAEFAPAEPVQRRDFTVETNVGLATIVALARAVGARERSSIPRLGVIVADPAAASRSGVVASVPGIHPSNQRH